MTDERVTDALELFDGSWWGGFRLAIVYQLIALADAGQTEDATSIVDKLGSLARGTYDFRLADPRPFHLRRELWIGKRAYHAYLKSDEWQRRRQEALDRFGYRCAACNRGDLTLSVHHRTYECVTREHPDDLTVLCQPCHHHFHKQRSEETA